MARTTAPDVGAKGNDRCLHCHTRAEATATNGTVTIRVCLNHALPYVRDPKVDVTPDPEANVALCACNRFVGHAGRASHACHARQEVVR